MNWCVADCGGRWRVAGSIVRWCELKRRRLWWEAKGRRKCRQMVRTEASRTFWELKRRDRRQRRAEASRSALIANDDAQASRFASIKCRNRCGLELSASPLSLIGDGLSFIDDGWAQWRLWFVFFWLELSAILSAYPFFFFWSKWLLKCFVALGSFLMCWVLKLGLEVFSDEFQFRH